MDIAVAWSDWTLAESDGVPYLVKLFDLREDLLGTDVLSGWVGFQLDCGASVDQYSMMTPETASLYITGYELNCAVLNDTTDDDMEAYWPIVADRFRERSLSYSE